MRVTYYKGFAPLPVEKVEKQNGRYIGFKPGSKNTAYFLEPEKEEWGYYPKPKSEGRYSNLHRADLSNLKLQGIYLATADLTKANLQNTNLNEASLNRTNLNQANLSNSNLQNADCRAANLSLANLSSSNLQNTDLRSADIRGANFSKAQTEGIKIKNAIVDPGSRPQEIDQFSWYFTQTQASKDALAKQSIPDWQRKHPGVVGDYK